MMKAIHGGSFLLDDSLGDSGYRTQCSSFLLRCYPWKYCIIRDGGITMGWDEELCYSGMVYRGMGWNIILSRMWYTM